MRVRIERSFITTATGTRVLNPRQEASVVEADTLRAAIVTFIGEENGRLLGTVSEFDHIRAVATGWLDGRLYVLAAEPAPD